MLLTNFDSKLEWSKNEMCKNVKNKVRNMGKKLNKRGRTEKEEEPKKRKKSRTGKLRKHEMKREESTQSAAQTISATFFLDALNASFALDSVSPAPIAIFRAVSSVIRFSGA